jgi:hypothetical protein
MEGDKPDNPPLILRLLKPVLLGEISTTRGAKYTTLRIIPYHVHQNNPDISDLSDFSFDLSEKVSNNEYDHTV